MNYVNRQENLIKLLKSESLDALLVRKKENVSYLTGVKGDDAILFSSGKKKFLITDSRYAEEYSRTARGCELRITGEKDAHACILEISKRTRSRHIGFESNNFSYLEYSDLKKKLKDVALKPVKDAVESLRMIKEKEEVRHIKRACGEACDIMNYVAKMLGPGLTEIQAKNRIELYIAKKGVTKAGFDIIVASGSNASMPHTSSSNRKIKKGEIVIIDLGTTNYGYNSDLTRTIFLGRIERKYLQIYNVVLDAQKKAIENIRPGISSKSIDNISRQYIINKGLGRYFVHSLGHGIGLEVHEKPRLSKNDNTILKENMTVTIEPGVYIPGWGGVRIEDIALVTKQGCEILTSGCKK